MADAAAHLVDRGLPEVPVRQWVRSLSFGLRYRLAYDAPLTSAVLGVFVRTVFASLRRRARRHWGVARGQCGAVTFVQRFGDALNLNVHFHSLLLDGVYERWPDGVLRFHPLPPPEDAEVERVVGQVARRIARLLERRGLGPEADPSEVDPLAEDEPLLAQLLRRLRRQPHRHGPPSGPARAACGRLHRPGRSPGRRRRALRQRERRRPARERGRPPPGIGGRLERLCRYVARPPVATERLSRMEDGRHRLEHRWRDGTTHVVFEPQELVEKLAAGGPDRRDGPARIPRLRSL